MNALTSVRLWLRAVKIPTPPILRIACVRILAARWCVVAGVVSFAGSAGAFDYRAASDSLVLNAPVGGKYDTAHICDMIRETADHYGLPREYFARLIWKESRFDIKALSPVGAQGIAQFMPGTARIRGLKDPWDPVQALPASASFLSDLRKQFGNFGLAAAAYNGGPHRVERWLRKKGGLPTETRNYVQSITHRPVEWFRSAERRVEHKPLEKGKSFDEGCRALPIISTRTMGRVARSPWGVQIAAGISRSAALKAFKRARRKASSVIGGRGAIVVRSKKVAGRRLYSARVGAGSRASARKLCNRIRRTGVPCVVRRN
jgi:soluble lytic murein transglycosylase-like protein